MKLAIDGKREAASKFACVVVGTVVDPQTLAEFNNKIKPHNAEEFLKAIIHSVVNGDLCIGRKEGAE